jgi:Xaa-Pro dipeptidase
MPPPRPLPLPAYNPIMLSRRRFLATAAATAPALALSAQTPSPPAETPALPAPILALTDRRPRIIPITVAERESRLDAARALMTSHKINALVVTTGASLQYFTAARWGTSERLFAYVLPAAAAPFVLCPNFERDRFSTLLRAFPEHDTTLTYFWQENEDPFRLLQRALAEVGVTTGTLAIEEHTPFAFSHAIATACPALTLVSANPVTTGCRSIKSPAEIALLRLANSITWDVYSAVHRSCGPGDTTHRFTELVNLAYARCGVTGEASCQVGPNSASPHGTLNPQTIREREIVLIDDGCSVEGYQSDISRTFVYGAPTDEQRKVFDIVHQAQSAALAAARPGVEMQAVDAAARAVITSAGYGPGYAAFSHRLGHGIGLDMHESPYLVGGNTQKLAPHMLFSNEPGIYLPGKFGVRLEDDMLLTETAAELLTPQSASLENPFGTAQPPSSKP